MASPAMTPAERLMEIGKALACQDPSCTACREYTFKTKFRTHCPLPQNHNHGDRNPSLEIELNPATGTIVVRCWTGKTCTEDAVIAELRARGLWWSSPPRTGLTVAQLAAARGFGSEFLSGFGVRDGKDSDGLPAVQIPYTNTDGTVVAVHKRLALTGGQRFAWRSGDKVTLYGLDRLASIYRAGWVALVEGETDCWAGWRFDLPLLGLPGKTTWKSEWKDFLLRDGLDVFVWLEPDAEDMVANIARDLPALRVLRPEGVKDICEAYMRGDDLRQLLDTLRANSVPAADVVPTAGAGAWTAPWEVEASAHFVDGAALIQSLETVFRKYLVLPEGTALTMALYAIMTYLVDQFDALGYLVITSPQPRCGKSHAQALLGATVFHPMSCANMSEAAVYRLVDAQHPTLLLDEAQLLRQHTERSAAIHDLLCAGYQRGMPAIRLGGPNRDQIQSFDTFGPKAISLVGKLANILMERGIEIPMRRKLKTEKCAKLFRKRLVAETDPLRKQLRRWADDHRHEVGAEFVGCEKWAPDWLADRENELWAPLLAIVRIADPAREAEALRAAARAGAAKEADADELPIRLLADIRDIFGDEPFMSSEDLVKELLAIEDGPWQDAFKGKPLTMNSLARVVREFKIEPGIGGERGKTRGYARQSFEDEWNRYLPPERTPDPEGGPRPGGPSPASPLPSPSSPSRILDPATAASAATLDTQGAARDEQPRQCRSCQSGSSPYLSSDAAVAAVATPKMQKGAKGEGDADRSVDANGQAGQAVGETPDEIEIIV